MINMASTHPPRIETEDFSSPSGDLRTLLDTTSPSFPQAPSFRLSISTNNVNRLETTEGIKSHAVNHARDEGHKLLAHVLMQLRNRMMPPSVSEAVSTLSDEHKHDWNLKAATKVQFGKIDRTRLESESLDDEGRGYSTDATFKFMIQLQEILVMSLEQRWDIFDSSGCVLHFLNSQIYTNRVLSLLNKPVPSSDSDIKPSMSPFRRSRASLNNSGIKSRSPSPSSRTQLYVSELLTLCISVLASVVAEDCRFRINSPRPFSPPNALQAITLNVAQVLLLINAHNFHIVSQIGHALIPAFSSFDRAMYPRIISFFNQGIIRNSLSSLRKIQGVKIDQNVVESETVHHLSFLVI